MDEQIVASAWVPVPGFETHYAVSNQGILKRTAGGSGAVAGRILVTSLSSYGYPRVRLCKNGRGPEIFVHQIVCAAFHGPRPTGKVVNHIDGVKTNNRAENLEWVTPLRNQQHASKMGLMATGTRNGKYTKPERTPRGENCGNSKLTESDVRAIRDDRRVLRIVASEYGVSMTQVSLIRRRGSWAWLGPDASEPTE